MIKIRSTIPELKSKILVTPQVYFGSDIPVVYAGSQEAAKRKKKRKKKRKYTKAEPSKKTK